MAKSRSGSGNLMSNSKAYSLALCGIGCALSLVVMLLGAVIPLFLFIAPALGGVIVMILCVECGKRAAWTEYVAVVLLSMMLVPDREVSLSYLYLGCYPLLKPWFERPKPKALRLLGKLMYLNGSVLAVYALLYLVLFPVSISKEAVEAELLLAGVTLLIGNIAFLLYDRALVVLLWRYHSRWRSRLMGKQR